MKRKASIASRLSTTVTLIMIVSVVIISIAVYWRAHRMVSSTVRTSAFNQMSMVVDDLDHYARQARRVCDKAARQATEVLHHHPDDLAQLDSIAATTLWLNPQCQGCTIALLHGGYSATAQRTADGGVHIVSYATSGPDHTQQAWFRQVQNSWECCWIEPSAGETAPCSMAMPLFSADSAFLGVIGLQLGNQWIDSLTSNIRIFEHTYCLVLTPTGTRLNHSDVGAMLKSQGVLRNTDQIAAEIQSQVAEYAHAGRRGSATVHTHELRATCFYLPVASTGWEIALVSPLTDAYPALESFFFFILIIILLCSIALIAVVNAVTSKVMAPLGEFAEMARRVAVGEFDAPLPMDQGQNELADLTESFGFMQQSLATNIEELKRTTAEQERLESEFHIARRIQFDLVPNIFPAFPDRKDIDIHAVINPWRESGGNLYDFEIVDNKLCFCIGDVAGNGILAAIFMSSTFKLVHAAFSYSFSPEKALFHVNRTMAAHNSTDMFVTLFYGSLNLTTGQLDYCCAGQDAPLLVTPDGEVKPLDVIPNIPVGLMADTPYEQQTTTLAPGTMMMLYTDGVVEAANLGGDLYGTDRLMRRLALQAHATCEQATNAIRQDVVEFCHGNSQDDCTALALRWNGPAPSLGTNTNENL